MARLPRVLSEADRRRLLDYLQERVRQGGEQALRDRALIFLMLGAGLRVAEAVGVEVRDLDLQHDLVRVNCGKGARDRVLPIDQATAHVLAQWALRRMYDIREVQELLGHSSVATTMIYTHVDPARLSRRVQELGVI